MNHEYPLTASSYERFEGLISVSTIRSQNPLGFGGCIFSGCEVDTEGKKLNSKLYIVIVKSYLLPCDVEKGECWRISGPISGKNSKDYNGYKITEVTIEPDIPLVKERETGDLIINLVARNPKFKRIGEVRMRKLWNKYGNDIYKILDNRDVEPLAKDLGEDIAACFIEAWGDHVSGSILSFLASHKIPVWLSRKVIECHGVNVKTVLEEDPYRLLSFTASWECVDSLARQHFGIAEDNPLRLRAAIEESLYRLVDRMAHTCVPSSLVRGQLKRLLQANYNKQATNRLVDEALADNESNGAYIITPDGHYWPTGAYIMEEYVADKIAQMVSTPEPFSPSLFMSTMSGAEIERRIDEFEKNEQIRQNKSFYLNEDQRKAVHNCVTNRFSIITGGAGTGKTTVLRCLYFVLTKAQYSICQMALSGRAAKRMHIASGVNASTIAGYLRNSIDIKEKLGDFGYYVIDEASMLDLSTTYQIFRSIPEDKNIRIVMVGDPYQLPPIMAGLIFQVLSAVEDIPIVHLKEVKRQEEESGIPVVANSIRYGAFPIPSGNWNGVRFISCPDKDIIENVINLFSDNPGETQILCATKGCARSGSKAINSICRERFSKGERELLVGSDAVQGGYGYSGIREKDRAMFTKNDYARKVYNGSIGTIIEIYDNPKDVLGFNEPALAKGEFEGVEVEIFESDVAGKRPQLELGYAVTVHKAQGSQWPRVIIPIRKSRNLDRTLVYTALTRAESEVILVGDMDALQMAVEKEPIAHTRHIGFRHLLTQKIHQLKVVYTDNNSSVD